MKFLFSLVSQSLLFHQIDSTRLLSSLFNPAALLKATEVVQATKDNNKQIEHPDKTDEIGVSFRFYNTIAAIIANKGFLTVRDVYMPHKPEVEKSAKNKIPGDQMKFNLQQFTDEEASVLLDEVLDYVIKEKNSNSPGISKERFLSDEICDQFNGKYSYWR